MHVILIYVHKDEDNEGSNPTFTDGEDELHIEPEPLPQIYEQNEWMEQLKTLHHIEKEYYEDDNDYDDAELLIKSRLHNWQEDRLHLGLEGAALADLPKWLEEQKQTCSDLGASHDQDGPTVDDLNEKQRVAYDIIMKHIMKAQEVGLNQLPQLLLNISGGAGTGKTFWLNIV